MDKADWQQIIENDYRLSDADDMNVLTDELLFYLDSPDPELRDTIGYNVFARWIISLQYYSDQQQRKLVELLIPKLRQSLGNRDDDTVFGRSYGALVLSLLAYQENRSSFMTDTLAHALLDETRHYLIAERDQRAYVDGKGWANACSHTADLLKFLAGSSIIESEDAKKILETVAEKVLMETDSIYHHDEDERLAHVVVAVMDLSLLSTYELEDWLKHFLDWKADHSLIDNYDVIYHATYQNIKSFLRSLYIKTQLVDTIPVDAVDFEPQLLNAIRKFSL
jgi:hypothetical protein